jgi:hypothetical protein
LAGFTAVVGHLLGFIGVGVHHGTK